MQVMCCPFCGSDNPSLTAFCRACGAELPRPGDGGEGSADALALGTLLAGTYAVESVLGQGGFGITYCAHDQMLDRRVAIKEFFPSGCRREDAAVQPARGLSDSHFSEARAQFLAEARLLARCHHAGIVGVHTAFEANSTAYMVMELLHGSHLGQLLDGRGGPLLEAEAVRLIERAGQALQFVHDQGLLHRDIKPENIIATDDGRVMLIDFGTAREYTQGQAQGHTIVVTPGYAPLEQYAKQARRGAFTDVYGLAATLYHLLTAQPPPAASDRAVGVRLPPVRDQNPQISAGVARAVEAGLEMEIARRPQSVREFLDLMGAPAIQAAPKPAAVEIALMPPENVMAQAQRDALLALSSPPADFFSTANQVRQQMLNEALADPQPASPVPLLPLLAPQSIITPPAVSGAPFGASPHPGGGPIQFQSASHSPPGSAFKTVLWWIGGITIFVKLMVFASSGSNRTQQPSSIAGVGYSPSNYSPSTYQPSSRGFDNSIDGNPAINIARAEAVRMAQLVMRTKELESTPAIVPVSIETLPISARVEAKKRVTRTNSESATPSILWQGLAEFSPEGELVAYMDGLAMVRVWSLSKRRVVSSLPQPKNHPPVGIHFSPDAKNVALTYADPGAQKLCDQVTVWNLATEKSLGTLSLDPKVEAVSARGMLPDGKVLITKTTVGSYHERLFLWDPRTGKQSAVPIKERAEVSRLDVATDGQQLVTGDKTGVIRWSDLRTGVQKSEQAGNLTYQDYNDSPFFASDIPGDVFLGDPLPVEALRFSRNGSYLASNNQMQIRVFDAKARVIGTLPTGYSPEFAVSPDGKWVVESSNWQNPERTMIWNVRKQRKIRLQGATGRIKTWSFSPDGQQVTGLSTSPMGASLATWRTDARPITPFSGRQIASLELPDVRIQAGTMSPSNRLSARHIGQSIEVRRFNGTRVESFDVGEVALEEMRFSPNGQKLSGRNAAGETRIWDVQTGQQVAQLEALKPLQSDFSQSRRIRGYAASSPVFSSDGSLLARAGSAAGKPSVEVWSLTTTARRIASLPLSQPVTALTFSADDGALICSEIGGRLSCYDVASRRLRARAQNGPSMITRLIATDQGLAVVSVGAQNRPATLVTSYDMPSSGAASGVTSGAATDLPSGEKRRVFGRKKQVALQGASVALDSLAISPDGQFVACSSRFYSFSIGLFNGSSFGGGIGSSSMPGPCIGIWHLPSGALMQTLPIETPRDSGFPLTTPMSMLFVEAVEFSTDGSQLHCISLDPVRRRQQEITWQCPPRQEVSP